MTAHRFPALLAVAVGALLAVSPVPAAADGASSRQDALVHAQIDGGEFFQCAIVDRDVLCWGADAGGRLGNGLPQIDIGGTTDPAEGERVGLGRSARAIAVGASHGCAILDTGDVRCWGSGQFGQLGQASTATIGDDEQPYTVTRVDLGPGRTARQISAGIHHTCVILDTGDVRCWGHNNRGQLGLGNTTTVGDDESPASVPTVDLGAGRSASAISAGGEHTCAVLGEGGRMLCWGANAHGQLGTGDTTLVGDNETPASRTPLSFSGSAEIRGVATGLYHTCAIAAEDLRCWGRNHAGQLGLGDTANRGGTPATAPDELPAVELGDRPDAIAAGDDHTCAIVDEEMRCWGSGGQGRLGLGNEASIGDDEEPEDVGPIGLPGDGDLKALSVGARHACGLRTSGRMRCWGYNNSGELGLGDGVRNLGDDELPASVPEIEVGGVVLTREADLSLTFERPAAPLPGQPFTAIYRLRNEGPEDAVADVDIETDLTAAGWTPSAGTFVRTDKKRVSVRGDWSEVEVPAGSEATLTVTLTAPSAGAFAASGFVSDADALDPDSMPDNGADEGEDDGVEDVITAAALPAAPGTGGGGASGTGRTPSPAPKWIVPKVKFSATKSDRRAPFAIELVARVGGAGCKGRVRFVVAAGRRRLTMRDVAVRRVRGVCRARLVARYRDRSRIGARTRRLTVRARYQGAPGIASTRTQQRTVSVR